MNEIDKLNAMTGAEVRERLQLLDAGELPAPLGAQFPNRLARRVHQAKQRKLDAIERQIADAERARKRKAS